MRARLLGALLVAVVAAVGCTPAPSPSEAAGGSCAEDLPPRTSPTDYPVAVLHAAGDDLPPVVGEVEWLGGEAPVATVPPRPVNLERFTVLQVRGLSEISIRMSDGVAIAAWRVAAIPDAGFRAGDIAGGRAWGSGTETTDLVCLPIRDGAWAIRADITFDGDEGHGTFYWRLNVSDSPSV